MTQNRGGFETDAGPSLQTLSTLVGVNTNQPNNFMPHQHADHLVFPVSQEESSTSVVNNVVNNSPSKSSTEQLNIICLGGFPF